MSPAPLAIRLAQAIGITSAAFAAGGTLCISYLYVPSLLLSPNPLIVRQWKKSFDVGKIVHPGIGLVSIIAYGYLAYQMKGTLDQHKAELYGLGALSSLLVWPWTIIVMMPTNKKLFKKNEEAAAMKGQEEVSEAGLPKGESAKELIDWWSTMNAARGIMSLAGAALGIWAAIN